MRARGRAVLVLFSVLLFASLFATIPTTAQEVGAGVMQSDDPRNLTFEQNRMYMYGNNDEGGSPDMWPMWTHSAANDVDSDDSLGETNVIGDPNNGGGPRSFTFDGTNPVSEPLGIDNTIAIVGKVKLAIFCDVESNSCTKQIDIVLRLGNRDLAQQSVNEPDEDNFYEFEFFVNDDEIPAGETFGLRITFQKPQSIAGGYTLYLGNGNSYMDIPVLAPYEETVPGLDNPEGYVSPYSEASSYTMTETNSTSLFGLILWGVIGIGIFVVGFTFLPPIPMKELSILFTGMGVLVSMLVAPIIAGPMSTSSAANPDDPDVWTAEEIAQLEERDGTFLGDELVEGYTFTFYAEYDNIYTTMDGSEKISGLGHEEYADVLGDPEVSRRGREYVQLFFSLFHMDLTSGQSITAEITIVNWTDPFTGEAIFLPQHIEHPNSLQEVTVDGEISFRFAIPHDLCTIYGEDSTWGKFAHISTVLGILLGGIGFWMAFGNRRGDQEMEYEDDEMDEDLDDLDDL
ncbi:MAG: hypothetical protein VX320_04655 [Candidatus Thermoplasmatota archaeon]|nr:hypothetical protein [Candidatus Thermoplasmatota archaeon]